MEVQNKRLKPLVMPEKYDGRTSWLDYLAHFESCAQVNDWSEQDKVAFLCTRLSGAARRTLASVLAREKNSYKDMIKALGDRFEPSNHEDLYLAQLKARHLQQSEKVEDLADDIRRMCELAYPTYDFDAIERVGRNHFLDAITDPVLRHDISLSGAKTLTEAAKVAAERNAFLQAEKLRNGESKMQPAGVDSSWEQEKREMQEKIDSIAADLKWWKQGVTQRMQNSRQKPDKRQQTCYYCDGLGHYFYECMQREADYEREQYARESSRNAGGSTHGNASSPIKKQSLFTDNHAAENQGN